jgi:L-rhamnose mutarotase
MLSAILRQTIRRVYMEKIAIHTRLQADKITDYERVHQIIPVELEKLLREHGVADWKIFRKGQDLFHFVECENYSRMLKSIEHHPVNLAWQKTMAQFLEIAHDYGNADTNTMPLVWELSKAASE